MENEFKKERIQEFGRKFENWKNSGRRLKQAIELGLKERMVVDLLSKDEESSGKFILKILA